MIKYTRAVNATARVFIFHKEVKNEKFTYYNMRRAVRYGI